MKDNLKDFIETNRKDFDTLEPRDLWMGINAGLATPTNFFTQLKKFKNMFKYAFGASALIIGSFFILNSLFEKKTNISASETLALPIKSEEIEEESPLKEIQIPESKLPSKIIKTNPSALAISSVQQTNELPESSTGTNYASGQTITSSESLNNSVRQENIASNPDTMASWQIIDTVLKNVKNLIVHSNFCKVTLNGSNREDVSFQGNTSNIKIYMGIGNSRSKRANENIKFSIKDSTLTVWVMTEKLKKNETQQKKTKENQGLHFEVPINTHVEITNKSDDIEVSNIVNANIKLTTTFGLIQASKITSTLEINAVSGDIVLSEINGNVITKNHSGIQTITNIVGNVKLLSNSGDVILKNLKGEADVTSSFGTQKFESIQGNIIAKAQSGDIFCINIDGNISSRSSFGTQSLKNVRGNVIANAGSGDIKLEKVKGLLIVQTSFGNISGKNVDLIKSGNFTTSSGDIDLEFLNEETQLSFELSSNSGDLEINKGSTKQKSDKKLQIQKGPILVKGVSSFGNQMYK